MKWVLFIGMAVATVYSFTVGPAVLFPEPELARLIFFHLPCAIATPLFLIAAGVASLFYLKDRKWEWEARALALSEMAVVLASATMLTGILFSKVQWGAWWHWDPKQTSFLIVLLILGAYFAVRMAFDDETVRARVAASYSVLSLLPMLFLIFVFPNLPSVAKNSLHPQGVVTGRRFTNDYMFGVLGIFILLLALTIWMVRLNVKALLLAHAKDNTHGNLETDFDGPTAHRVDRAMPLSK